MEVKTDTCKGCGATIVWGESIDGKKIPLDPKPSVYFFEAKQNGSGFVATRAATMKQYQEGTEQLGFHGTSHFSTCPRATDFSKGGKARADAPPAPAVPAGWVPLTSSNLNACAFDGATQRGQPGTLQIQFKTGGIWKYKDVPDDVFEDLKKASSPGKFFLDDIKGRFQGEKVEVSNGVK